MKLDMELVRKIMLAVEAGGDVDKDGIEGYDAATIAFHNLQILDAGFAQGVNTGDSGSPPGAMLKRLTWAGNQFLANARNDTVWRKTMEKFGSSIGSVSLSVLSQLLAAKAKEMLTGKSE